MTFRRRWLAVLLLLVPALLRADDVEDRRAAAGIRLFRSLLTADVDLTKKVTPANQLLIVFYYSDDKQKALDLAARFVEGSKDGDKIRGVPVVTEVANDAALAAYAGRVPAGIFLTGEPTQNGLASLIRFGVQHRVIVYSPFEGHVERGVLGGLSVEAQVRPYINRATMESSQITLKSFFLQVAKVYQ
jgi:hypothetical protein